MEQNKHEHLSIMLKDTEYAGERKKNVNQLPRSKIKRNHGKYNYKSNSFA